MVSLAKPCEDADRACCQWAYLQESLVETSEDLVAMAKKLEVWTDGMATSPRTDGS